ncbi:MAG: hypothetical protein HYV20_13555 [Gemmatimonadetes bacterium]|nr:hypothetical protein [Gemmatimonadota bacterium]
MIPLARHVAEKVHAYARTYGEGRASTRVKDLVDLVLRTRPHPPEPEDG